MRMKKRKPINIRQTTRNYNGEASPYWEFLNDRANKHGDKSNDGGATELREYAEANPDILDENQVIYPKVSDEHREEFDKVVKRMSKLSMREKQVIQLLWDGRSMSDVATILQIKKGTVQSLLNRAREKFSDIRKEV